METLVKVGTSPTLGIRGVLAARDIKKGELIETCPVLPIPIEEEKLLENTVIWKYYFAWSKKADALVLGYGSLYNHSDTPNAEFDFDYEKKCVYYTATEDIKENEEIFIDYEWQDDSPRPFSEELDFDKHLNS